MSEFTKGPWAVFGDWGITDISGRFIAQFEPLSDDISSGNSSESFANANLIAAAPDMYEALEEALKAMLINGFDPDCVPVVKLKYTLKKARGEL